MGDRATVNCETVKHFFGCFKFYSVLFQNFPIISANRSGYGGYRNARILFYKVIKKKKGAGKVFLGKRDSMVEGNHRMKIKKVSGRRSRRVPR